MEVQYRKEYSPALGRDMECKIYGHKGRPVLFIPCQDGRFFDFENFQMTDTWSPWLESGEVMVFSIDTIDQETWSDTAGDPYWRIRRYEQWLQYITDEMVPFMREMVNERNGWTGYPGIMVFGCSLGATHAANLYFRRPDLFDRLLALSGLYSAGYGFGSYTDEVVRRNSLVDFLGDMPRMIRGSRCIISRKQSSASVRDHGNFRTPRGSSHRSLPRRISMPGWISGAMTVLTTGTGGINR